MAATETSWFTGGKKVLAGGCGWSWCVGAASWVTEELLEGVGRLAVVHRNCPPGLQGVCWGAGRLELVHRQRPSGALEKLGGDSSWSCGRKPLSAVPKEASLPSALQQCVCLCVTEEVVHTQVQRPAPALKVPRGGTGARWAQAQCILGELPSAPRRTGADYQNAPEDLHQIAEVWACPVMPGGPSR